MHKAPRPTKDITLYRYKSRPFLCGHEVKLEKNTKIPSLIPLSTSLSQGFVLAWQAKIKETIENSKTLLQDYKKKRARLLTPGYKDDNENGELLTLEQLDKGIKKLEDLEHIIPDDCCIYEITISKDTPCILTGRIPDGKPYNTTKSVSMFDEYEVLLPPGVLTVTEIIDKHISEDDKQKWKDELTNNKDNKGKYLDDWLKDNRTTVRLYKCTYEPFKELHKVSVDNNLKSIFYKQKGETNTLNMQDRINEFKQSSIYKNLMSLMEDVVKPYTLEGYKGPNYVPSTFIYHKDYLCNKDKVLQDIRDGVYGPPVLNDTGGVELIMFKAPDAYQQTAGAKPSKLQTLIQKHKEAVKEMLAAQKAYTQAVRKNKLSSSELKKLADKGFRAEAKAMKAFEAVKAAKRMGQK